MDKVPPAHTFLDLSDYARPLARWLVARLLLTPISPIHLTLAFTLAGLAAAALFALDRWLPLAGGLLLAKSALDAADGSLARARGRPSRFGRFLDSIADFVVNLAVYAGIAWGAGRASPAAAALGLAALLSGMLQVSAYNYYFVLYRAASGGDQTSQVREAAPQGYAWDDPALLSWLFTLYKMIYGWQDRLVERVDRWAAPRGAPIGPGFLTAASVLGLGTQLLVIALFAALGWPAGALWVLVTVFNAYGLLLLALRRRHAHPPHLP